MVYLSLIHIYVPVDTLKLDRGFFGSNQQKNDRGGYIVESIIELAKKLKMQTVSEGVETKEQVAFLKKANCDMVQGYVFAKPVPICLLYTSRCV